MSVSYGKTYGQQGCSDTIVVVSVMPLNGLSCQPTTNCTGRMSQECVDSTIPIEDKLVTMFEGNALFNETYSDSDCKTILFGIAVATDKCIESLVPGNSSTGRLTLNGNVITAETFLKSGDCPGTPISSETKSIESFGCIKNAQGGGSSKVALLGKSASTNSSVGNGMNGYVINLIVLLAMFSFF